MQIVIVNPFVQQVRVGDFTVEKAMAEAGLVNVDHGVVAPITPDHPVGLAIIVYEFGLFAPPESQSYFVIAGHLYAGNAVIYGFNKQGDTVDIPGMPRVVFMPSARAVERNIELGLVQRPYIAANGVVTWRWPEKRKQACK